MKGMRALIAGLFAVFVAVGAGHARPAIGLDGEWECVYAAAGKAPGPEASWEPVEVPSVLEWQPEGPHCVWYRRDFYVPASWMGRRVVLRFEGVKYRQRVWVNGKEVGDHLGGYEPTEYDISEQVVLGGRNSVVVSAEDWTALIAEGAKLGEPDPWAAVGTWVKDGILAPIGCQGWEVGMWGSVSVEARPRVWVADVFVVPSVREGKLRVQVTVKNEGSSEERAAVTARVGGGGPGPRMGLRELALGAEEEKTVTLEASWENPRLWSPEDPHLYSLVAGARARGVGDSVEVGFGFREFWVEGDQLVLNGAPVRLLGTWAHPMREYDGDPREAYEEAREAGCVAMRLGGEPWPGQWYRAADEAGMLVVWESALWRLGESYALSKEEFWRNARAHVAAQIRGQRNHPAIIMWSAESGLLSNGGARVEGTEEKVGGLGDAIRELDATRPVMFEGEGDPGGKADIVSVHCRPEVARWGLGGERCSGFADWAAAVEASGDLEWDRTKPLYIGEMEWLSPWEAESSTVLLGDEAYPDLEAARVGAMAVVLETMAIGAREAGVGGICAWNLWEEAALGLGREALERAYAPVGGFTRERGRRAFGGRVVERTIVVLNDTAWPRLVDVRWRLGPAGGEWEVTGSETVLVEPAGGERVEATLAIPPMAEEVTPCAFTVELWEGGEQVFSESQEWKVYGREALSGPAPGAPRRVAIYDPRGETTRVLSEMGVEGLPITEEEVRRTLYWGGAVVIGKGAFEEATTEEWLVEGLGRYVQSGGTVVVFEQDHYPESLIPVSLSSHDSVAAFPRCEGHPALAGVEAGDLACWGHDGLVGRREVVKPERVGFLALVDSGGPEGLATAGLAELRVGRGRMVLCQLDVTRKCGLEPGATKVVRNLLGYVSQRPEGVRRTAAVCGDEEEAALEAIGLRYDRLEAPAGRRALGGYGVVVVCGLDQEVDWGGLGRFVREGGRVVLHAIAPGDLDLACRLVGAPLRLGGPATAVWVTDRSGAARGLSNEQLAWLAPAAGDRGWGELMEVAEHTLMAGEAPEGSEQLTLHTEPGVLASVRSGKGLWVIDQVGWEAAGDNEGKARRYLAGLLTNLGCEFEMGGARREEAAEGGGGEASEQ